MITSSIDLAQVVLYAFWIFFFGLVYWLRKEDRREGYPLETDTPRRLDKPSNLLIPSPKTFLLPEGGESGEYQAPNYERDEREMEAERTLLAPGSPHVPKGEALLANVGPSSYAERHDEPERTREGHLNIVPLRAATDFSISAGPDARGWKVVDAKDDVAGTIKDLWVDRADMLVRYLEVELEGAPDIESYRDSGKNTRLVPMPLVRLEKGEERAKVTEIHASQYEHVPTLANADQVTALEEDKIGAFFAGGRLYADAKRAEPLV